MKKLLTTTALILLSICVSAQSLREIYQAGVKAYEEKDYQLFKEKMFTIDSMRPNYPVVVYNLAGAYALTGETEKSIQRLNQYLLMDATKDFASDEDFASILNTSGFKKILTRQKELMKEIPVDVAKEFSILTSHPECITWSEKQKAIFMGGVRDGKIWRMKDGKEPEVWAESAENSWAVMGLDVSPDGKTLWACTSAMSNYEGLSEEDKGKASVLKYDLKKGKLLETFELPADHVFGDLITSSNGDVFISDSNVSGTANYVYRIGKEGKLEVFADLRDTFFNLQGLTFNADESALYLSDYIDGIYRLDMDTKELTKLETTQDVLLKGIDGLYFQNNALIAMHNGQTPNRVVKYMLNDVGDAIEGSKVLAQAGGLGEPTQGTMVGGSLYFISNSPWGSYDREGNFNVNNGNIVIGEIK